MLQCLITAVFIYSSYYKYWTNLYGLPVAGWNDPESGTKLNVKGLAKSVSFVICFQQFSLFHVNSEIKSLFQQVSLGRSSACQMVSMKQQIRMHDETSWYFSFASVPSISTDNGETISRSKSFRTTVQNVLKTLERSRLLKKELLRSAFLGLIHR